MTREEARKAAEVMLAYADGKEIEQHWGELWVINKEPKFDWSYNDYRIKPQPTYRPFVNAEECWQEMQKHQPFGWLKDKTKEYFWLLGRTLDMDTKENRKLFEAHTFADGEPFGVKEEEYKNI